MTARRRGALLLNSAEPLDVIELRRDLRDFRRELAAKMVLSTDHLEEAELCRMLAGILAREERLNRRRVA